MARKIALIAPNCKPADHKVDCRMVALVALSIVVGTGGALGAWVLLKMIAIATNLFWFGQFSWADANILNAHHGINTLVAPVLGSLIIGIMARYGSEKIKGHGIPEAIESILYNESRMSLKVAVLKPFSAAISIGSGGPFGAEGPIIMTGGALGSLFAQSFHLSAAERKTLLVAGATAGMTAIFNTPLAAALLGLEVLLFEWKPRSFVPVVTAVLISWCWRFLLFKPGPLFAFTALSHVNATMTGWAALIGLLTGGFAILLSNSLYCIEDLFQRLPIHWMWWPALASVVVGVGGVIEPRALGTGYGNIQDLLNADMLFQAALILLAVKSVIWLISLGSGTSGGVVAPLLILGGAVGSLCGSVLPGEPGVYAMLGMAGILSGAMRAPLTGAIFAVEVTGHFNLLPAALAASMMAYAVSVLSMSRSIFTERLARRGYPISQEYVVDPLETTTASEIMTSTPTVIKATARLDNVTQLFLKNNAHHNYPVTDNEGKFLGIISRIDILQWFNEKKHGDETIAGKISETPPYSAAPNTKIGDIADYFFNTQSELIAVVDPATHLIVGVVTRHDLLKARSFRHLAETIRTRTFISMRT